MILVQTMALSFFPIEENWFWPISCRFLRRKLQEVEGSCGGEEAHALGWFPILASAFEIFHGTIEMRSRIRLFVSLSPFYYD